MTGRAFALVALLACASCASSITPGKVLQTTVAVGADAMTCAPGEQQAIEDAIAHGGADWLGVIVASFQCLGPAIQHIEQMFALQHAELAELVADDAPDAAALPDAARKRSRGLKRRLAAAKVFNALLTKNVRP